MTLRFPLAAALFLALAACAGTPKPVAVSHEPTRIACQAPVDAPAEAGAATAGTAPTVPVVPPSASTGGAQGNGT